ncbi:MAG TPA: biosynthetic arginine decarboxylase [Bdellovibrionota bacterium]|nr:biosynthetic arginine decarboxylase [Bdellovibrionota bacterium]
MRPARGEQRMDGFNVEDALNLYGVDLWGAGYFGASEEGRLEVLPTKNDGRRIEILKVVEELRKSRIGTPLLLRFPQILESQVQALTGAFQKAIVEFQYQQGYYPVFPIKVNQRRTVVEGLLEAGYKQNLGIEVGSKPELMGALALSVPAEALTVCNGFKDRDYLITASMGVRMGRKVVVVIEKPFELDGVLELAQAGETLPWIGFRVKLNAKGSGLWEKSGGGASKFGLSTSQLLDSIEILRQKNLLGQLKLFHFHIGSQVTEIRKIKEAIKEGARVYAKARKMGVPIEYLNVGGGLGIDYDGSKTSSDASVNYTMEEYANDVVYNIADVCENEHVPHPKIVSESGRALVAYHAMLVVDVRGHINGDAERKNKLTGHEPRVIEDLLYIRKNISVKNYREFFHDAIERRDEMYSLFNLGMLELEDRSKGEWLYWEIARQAVKYSKTAKFQADEFNELQDRLFEKYICNFSVFQSIPDHWALDQLFPVVPIHRLNEKPTKLATLVDITCDSDGEVEKFVDLKDIKGALEVHELQANEPYYLAFLLIGAYQETMGDLHNLFGAVNEAHVIVDDGGKMIVQNAKKGETVRKTLEAYGYEPDKLVKSIKTTLQEQVTQNKMDNATASKLAEEYKRRFEAYPYLGS